MIRARAAAERNTKTATENNRRYCRMKLAMLGTKMPVGRLIMNLEDIEKVCMDAPDAMVIASHLDSVNHAVYSSDDVRAFIQQKNLTQVLVPCNGETIEA